MRKLFYIPLLILAVLSCSKDQKNGSDDDEDIIILDKPTGLVQIDKSVNSIKVSWNPVENAAEYTYCLSEQTGQAITVLARGITAKTYKTISGLDPHFDKKGISYWFSVAAVKGKSTSGDCEPIQVEPSGIPRVALVFNAAAAEYLAFTEGMKASVNDGIDIATYSTGQSGAQATFEVESEYWPEPDMNYFVTVPETIDGMEVPAEYEYVGNVFTNLPMWARSESTNLYFNTYLGILALDVRAEESTLLKQLVISAEEDLAGEIVSHTDGELPVAEVEGSKSITISFGDGLEVGTAETIVYVPVPAGNYSTISLSASLGDEDPLAVDLENVTIAAGAKTSALALFAKAPKEYEYSTLSLDFTSVWPFKESIASTQSETGDLYHYDWEEMELPFTICRGVTYKYQFTGVRMQLKKDESEDVKRKWILLPGIEGRFIHSVTFKNSQTADKPFWFKKDLDGDKILQVSAKNSTETEFLIQGEGGIPLMDLGESLYFMMSYSQLYYITSLSITYAKEKE